MTHIVSKKYICILNLMLLLMLSVIQKRFYALYAIDYELCMRRLKVIDFNRITADDIEQAVGEGNWIELYGKSVYKANVININGISIVSENTLTFVRKKQQVVYLKSI